MNVTDVFVELVTVAVVSPTITVGVMPLFTNPVPVRVYELLPTKLSELGVETVGGVSAL
jgi:hypothetical protein